MPANHIINYEDFQTILNKRLFDGSRAKLLKNIAENPDRFIGLFRPTKPATKLIQNLTQSHEIRFGDALEEVFAKYFDLYGFTNLPRKINISQSGYELNMDQLFETNNIIYLIEQKIRDDHDSTKKRGQFQNFENKYFEIAKAFPDRVIIPIMWFIDDSLTKNKNYYVSEMAKMAKSYNCSPKLCYGIDLFNGAVSGLSNIIWVETLEHLKKWKEQLPDMPEINFDNESDEVFQEIKDLKPSVYRALFENENIRTQILPILFPTGETFKKISEYFKCNMRLPIYLYICNEIDRFLN